MTQATFGALTIRAGQGARIMGEDGRYRRRYSVRVRSDATDRNIRFEFTDSIHNEETGKAGLGPDDLLEAFRCFVSDADAGNQEFADFASDYGYDQDSYSARQVHKACKAALVKFAKLYSDGRDPVAVLEQLSAIGVE